MIDEWEESFFWAGQEFKLMEFWRDIFSRELVYSSGERSIHLSAVRYQEHLNHLLSIVGLRGNHEGKEKGIELE